MMAEKVVKMAIQLATLVLLARYLGPSALGELYYCFAITSILLFFNTFGYESLFAKEFLDNENSKKSYVNELITFRFLAAGFCVCFVNISGWFLLGEEARGLLFVVSLYHLFAPFSVLQWYFQARGEGYISALSLVAGELCGFLFRLAGVALGLDIIWFGLAYTFEMAISAVVISKVYGNYGDLRLLKLSIQSLKRYASNSAPLMVSAALVLLYGRVDQIMLGYIRDSSEVGIYVSGARLTEAWFMVTVAIVDIYYPKYVQAEKVIEKDYFMLEILQSGRWLILAAIVIAVLTYFISEALINLIYDEEYYNASGVLSCSIWALPFVALGAISTKLYILSSRYYLVMWRSLFGLIINIVLNIFLLKKYGAIGAAISTVISQIAVGYLFNFLNRRWDIVKLQTKMLLFKPR